MHILIAGTSDANSERIRGVLTRNAIECASSDSVPLERAADRASRLRPDLLVLDLTRDPPRGLETLREIRTTIPSVYVLVVGHATDPKFILRTLHDGADEFLDDKNLEGELTNVLHRFQARESFLPELEQSGKVISVLSPSGGSGSSMLASNIGVVLAGKYGECALVDLRLSAGDLASMLDLQPTRGIADLCDHLAHLDQCLFAQFFTRHDSGVCLLATSGDLGDVPRVTSKGVRRALAMARVRFPYVVVDLDSSFGGEQIEALWQSDVVLMVIRLDYTSIRNARRTLQNFTSMGLGLDRVRLVANGYGQRKQLSSGQAEEALGMKILHYIPSDPASVHQAINKGVPVALYRPSAKISRRIGELAASVNGRDGHGTTT